MDEDRQRALRHIEKARAELMKARAILSNDELWDDTAGLVADTEAMIRRIKGV